MLQKLGVKGPIEQYFSSFHLRQNLTDYCVPFPEFLTCRSEVGPGNLHSNKFPDVVDAACLGNTTKRKQPGELLSGPNSNQQEGKYLVKVTENL